MKDLQQLASFVSVAELRSFSRAADRLGISKALVSRHVAELELSLGCKLLKRTTRNVGVTSAGLLVQERAVQLIEFAEAAAREVEALSNEPAAGTIRVCGGSAFGPLHLVPAIARFLALHPGIKVILDINERAADLVSDDVDVAVRTGDAVNLNSLVARRLAPLRRVLCASPDYLARHRAPRSPQELVEYNCLIYRVDARGEWHVRGPEGRTSVRVSGSFHTNSSEAVNQAALSGAGIAFVPTFSAGAHLRSGALVRVLPEHEGDPRVLYASHLPDRNLPQRIRLFERYLEAHFGPEPYWDAGLGPFAAAAAEP